LEKSNESIKAANTANLLQAFSYLQEFIQKRMRLHYAGPEKDHEGDEPESLQLAFYDDQSELGSFIKKRQPKFEEYIIILLALVPHIQPDFLDKAIKEALPESGSFPEIGGVRDKESRALLATGELALFLLAGDNLNKRFEVQRILTADHWLTREGILYLEKAREGEPFWSGRLVLTPDYIELFTLGHVSSPSFSASFPAREIHTELEWEDLVLCRDVLEQIEDIRNWVEHNETLMREWGMQRILKPGYRVLLHGPPGTGKTLTATLLGKYTGRPVFRIDLSTVVSKYIGETEKNLSGLFDKARKKQWILFFDEADALFGKRTNVKDAHDRYANQEVSYLLQRVEEFDGLVILASNFKANMDDAFLRRFNSVVRFPFPTESERIELWRKTLPQKMSSEEGVDLPTSLGKFELAGGSINNVVQQASLDAIARGSEIIRYEDALRGVRREIEKEGKIFKNFVPGKSSPVKPTVDPTAS
jgi:AAA+ superfamily predicted ATPase